jgi:hypothetical protein
MSSFVITLKGSVSIKPSPAADLRVARKVCKSVERKRLSFPFFFVREQLEASLQNS